VCCYSDVEASTEWVKAYRVTHRVVLQVRDKVEEDQENLSTPSSKSRTLGGTLTLRRPKKTDDSEPHVDPKMATMRRNLHTEDGSKIFNASFQRWIKLDVQMAIFM
jgi:hypothetical protein